MRSKEQGRQGAPPPCQAPLPYREQRRHYHRQDPARLPQACGPRTLSPSLLLARSLSLRSKVTCPRPPSSFDT